MENNKVTICSSASFINEAEQWKKKIESKGFNVIQIPLLLEGNYREVHSSHYKSITQSDLVFVLNLDKNGVEGYIGPSVFAEIAYAIGLNISMGKKIDIFCLNPIPSELPYSKELLLWRDMGWIGQWK